MLTELLGMFWALVFSRAALYHGGPFTAGPIETFVHSAIASGWRLPVDSIWRCVDLIEAWRNSPTIEVRKIGNTSKVKVNGIEAYTISKVRDGWKLKPNDGWAAYCDGIFPTRDDALEALLITVW